MPTISTETIKHAGQDFKKVIKCDSRGTFTIGLPPAVVDAFNVKEVQGTSIQIAKEKFNQTLKDFAEANTAKRKVIIYDIKLKTRIFDANGNAILVNDDIHFTDGAALSVECGIFEEFTFEINGVRTVRNERVESTLPKSIQSKSATRIPSGRVIEWTQDREQFFARLGRAMDAIALELYKFRDPRTVMQLADAGIFALPLNQSH